MTDGMKSDDTPLRHAAGGPGGGDEAVRHHRAALPVDRSVLWAPIRDPGDPAGPAGPPPLLRSFSRRICRARQKRSLLKISTSFRRRWRGIFAWYYAKASL